MGDLSPTSGNEDRTLEDGNPACERSTESSHADFALTVGTSPCELAGHTIKEQKEEAWQDGMAFMEVESAGEWKVPGLQLFAPLCLVGALESADGVLLPCTFFALQQDLGLTLNGLALLSMAQAIAGNFAGPLWGMLADWGTLRRKTIIVGGCVLQGLITVLLAGVDQLWPMVVLRALNGAMLASLRPIANGILADASCESNRGKVYGGMGIATNLGTMAGTLVATNLARQTVLGMQGWRAAFLLMGGASVVVGLITCGTMTEPLRNILNEGEGQAKGRGCAAFKDELARLSVYFRMPTFCVLILQGCFGSVPWNALGYKTLFFQLGGITDAQASLISVFSQLAGALGALLGGCVGDGLSRCSKDHGRPITAQISVLCGIPIAWLIFMHRPPAEQAFAYYSSLLVALGLTATWCGVGVNLPILAELVREERRATIMAWEGALASSCSAMFGHTMVALLAQNVFGYDLAGAREGPNPGNMEALGSALALVSFCPWMLCFICYFLLHWSYPRDLRWHAQLLQSAKRQTMLKELDGASPLSRGAVGAEEGSSTAGPRQPALPWREVDGSSAVAPHRAAVQEHFPAHDSAV